MHKNKVKHDMPNQVFFTVEAHTALKTKRTGVTCHLCTSCKQMTHRAKSDMGTYKACGSSGSPKDFLGKN